ncbi:ABC transporter substrate-binding protein [Chitinimonas sp. BJYL2]|uniref:substrate-binding periplasmic protein n=1 Tax=Chitinimonas sp. BJYL2 TaxID=2976696 RepID=UPI0022B5762D|nr:ABC transporter substrate-binding protein [Chitinimonas sp. BJYL2]
MLRHLLACLLLTSAMAGEPEVRVSAPDNIDPSVTIGARILGEAYRRIGYRMVLDRLPSLRSLNMANSGQYDAELGRVAGVGVQYPNLRAVPTPLGNVQIFAVSLSDTIRPRNWQELASYRIGTIRGAKVVEQHTKGMAVSYAPTEANLMAMLQRGRVEVLVLSDVLANRALARIRQQSSVPPVVTPFERIPVFHYVHQRNQHLIAPLDEALKSMHKDGTVERILEAARRESESSTP